MLKLGILFIIIYIKILLSTCHTVFTDILQAKIIFYLNYIFNSSCRNT